MRSVIHDVKFETRVCASGIPANPPQSADPNETIPINKFRSKFTNGPIQKIILRNSPNKHSQLYLLNHQHKPLSTKRAYIIQFSKLSQRIVSGIVRW